MFQFPSSVAPKAKFIPSPLSLTRVAYAFRRTMHQSAGVRVRQLCNFPWQLPVSPYQAKCRKLCDFQSYLVLNNFKYGTLYFVSCECCNQTCLLRTAKTLFLLSWSRSVPRNTPHLKKSLSRTRPLWSAAASAPSSPNTLPRQTSRLDACVVLYTVPDTRKISLSDGKDPCNCGIIKSRSYER